MAQVFISYSRKDKEFARRLSSALAAQDREAWVDWKDIPLTAEWQQEILTNIEAADTFIFIISPESVASVNCRKEIDHAAANNKRMVPILYRSVADTQVPETLARLQRIDLGEEAEFYSGFAALVKALDTDLDWVQAHTRLLTRAKEWERQGRDGSFLLRGKDLRDAEHWVARSSGHEPKPTPLQTQFLLVSRKVAIRQRRIMYGAAAVALLIAAGLVLYAVLTQRRKEDALARSLAGRSATILSQSGDTELAALLALESMERRSTNEGAQALRNSVAYLRRTRTFFAPGRQLSEIVFSPDSRRIAAVADRDTFARVYNVDSGRELLRLPHDAKVTKAVFSPVGRLVLTAAQDKTARLWDGVTGREFRRLTFDTAVNALAFSKDGLVATGTDTAAQVWEAQTGRQLVRLEFPKWVTTVGFSPSGRWFVAGARDGSVQLWDRVTGATKALTQLPTRVLAFDFSPADEMHLLIGGGEDDESSDLQIVDIGSGRILARGSYRSSFPLRRVLFAGGPNRIAVYGEGAGSIWDAKLTRLLKADVESTVDRTFLSPDGRLLLTIHHGTLRIADLAESPAGTDSARIPVSEDVQSAELSPDGRLLAVASNGANRILEVHSSVESLRHTGLGIVSDVSFSPGGRWAVVGSEPSWIVDLEQPWVRPRPIGSSHADAIAIDRDAAKVVTGSQTKLTVWDARSGSQLGAASLPGGQVPAPLAFSADSDRLLLSYTYDRLKSFEWATGRWSEDPRFERVHAISGDTRLLALRPDDHSVRIVEADTQRQVAVLPFEFAPYSMGFGGQNKLLISVEQGQGVAQLWDTDSRKELARVSDFDRIRSAAISPDGRLVATTGAGQSVRFQLWRKDELIRHACELMTRALTPEEWRQYLPEDAYAGGRTCPQFRSQKPK